MAERIEAADAPAPSPAPPADTESLDRVPNVSAELLDAITHDDPSVVTGDRSDNTQATGSPDWPDPDSIRITPDRAAHILDGDGDGIGGGHRAGTGYEGKTEFPANWDDDKILANIEDVARNPDFRPDEPQPRGTWKYEGTRDGVHITAIVNPDGTVKTAWPREGDPGVIKNPEKG